MLVAKDASAKGARIRFVEAGSGPPVLLVHDFAATREVWTQTLGRLAAHFRVIAPDLPGFGESEKPEPGRYAYGWDSFSESLFELVAALGLSRVHACGLGMGAGIALSLAARHPAVVQKLVLTSPVVYPPREHAIDTLGRIPVVGSLLWRQAINRALFRLYVASTSYAGARHPPTLRANARYDAFNTPAARHAALATLRAIGDTRPLIARLPRVHAETLVVWGRHDTRAPVEHGRRLARQMRARLDVLDSGRCPPEETPEAFANLVASFLASPSATQRSTPQARGER
jgi:pimeloyl-ACP methyl ester carboxylesterase